MKVGFFSPLPPARTGVADYSASLLGALRATAAGHEIEVDSRNADVNLYHLGNNQLHREVYRAALEVPGVVVLHDAVLHHFFLGTLDESAYLEEFTYNYGAWSEDLARGLWCRRARSGADAQYFRYPMLKRIAERSRAIIVHNSAAAAMVRDHAHDAAIHEIPHLFHPPDLPLLYEVIRLRQQLGVTAQTLLFGVFGHFRESKRLAAILRAFRKGRDSAPMALLIAGEFASSDLARSLDPLLRSDGIIKLEYAAEREFWLRALAVDACINLRYPAAGESSGITVRLMGIGKPVLVTTGCEVSRLPETSCIKVDAGPAEEGMLADYMVWLARYPADARAIGLHAADHIRKFHAPDRVATLYWEALTAQAPANQPV